jgi:glycosyltransferase involved in cell wall biosynthesis
VLIYGGGHHIKPISKIVPKDKMVFYLATEILNNTQDFSLCQKVILGNKRMISLLNESDIEFSSTKLVNLVPGIDINYYKNFNQENSRALREKFNIESDTTVITYVGRLVNQKGVSLLLNSCLKIHKSSKFKIILIGSLGSNFGRDANSMVQSDTEGIPELIEKLGSKCISTGFVKVEDLPDYDYLSLTDIGVVPSICEDVAPGSYLQFLCLGTATIVSDAGGIPEFFSVDYSLMFKRGENMEEELSNNLEFLINNPETRRKMGQNALRMRPTLSKERYYNDLVDLVLN